MTRDHAERTIRALLNVSLNATNYPLTLEPEPGKTGDWRFAVLPYDAWSWLKPSGHITWNGTTWRKPVPNTPADLVPGANDPADVRRETVMPSPPATKPAPTRDDIVTLIGGFLTERGRPDARIILHDITRNSARFHAGDDASGHPVWSGRVRWIDFVRCFGPLFNDADIEFDEPAAPVEPVPDLTATNLGPFYAAKVKAEHEAHDASIVAALERAHRANMDRFEAAMKPNPLDKLKNAIADYDVWLRVRHHSANLDPSWPTLPQCEDAILDAAHELCAAWKRR